jgi:hypothetical protein
MNRSAVLLTGVALVLSTSAGFAGELPEAPEMAQVRGLPETPQRPPLLFERNPWVEESLYVGVIATHAGDWASTEQCLRVTDEQERAGFVGRCHEVVLPAALVGSKVGLGAYEAFTAGAEIYLQYLLTEHHHRGMARIAQFANIGGTAYTVAHNYSAVHAAAHP